MPSFEHPVDCGSQAAPRFREFRETPFSCARHRVINAAAAVDRLSPRFQSAIAFQSVQHGIDDAFANGDDGIRPVANAFDNLIAIHLFLAKQSQNQEFWNSIHEVRIGVTTRHERKSIPRGSMYGNSKNAKPVAKIEDHGNKRLRFMDAIDFFNWTLDCCFDKLGMSSRKDK